MAFLPGRDPPLFGAGEVGELRVWKGHSDKPGLCFSRSIGDSMAKEVGVTEEPCVKAISLEADDRFVVIASAGVWKVCSPQDIVDMVASKSSATDAASCVVDEAKERWAQVWQGARSLPFAVARPLPAVTPLVPNAGENTTAIVVVLPATPNLLWPGKVPDSSAP